MASLAINYVVNQVEDGAASSATSEPGVGSRVLAWLAQQERWRKSAWCLAVELVAVFATSIWIRG